MTEMRKENWRKEDGNKREEKYHFRNERKKNEVANLASTNHERNEHEFYQSHWRCCFVERAG